MQPPLAKLSPVNLPIGDTPDKRSVPHKRSVPGIPPPHCHKNIPKHDYPLYIDYPRLIKQLTKANFILAKAN